MGQKLASENGGFAFFLKSFMCISHNATRESTYPSTAEKVIYFTVTNIECDPPSLNTALNPSDVHFGLSAGELGCWVDSAVTRLTQTGLEHARIPDISAVLGARFFPLSGATMLTAFCRSRGHTGP